MCRVINRYLSNRTMKTKLNTMTLRLHPELDELLTEASYDRRTTKADWIRAAIRARLIAERTAEKMRTNGATQEPER
jgi:hypothetical protein